MPAGTDIAFAFQYLRDIPKSHAPGIIIATAQPQELLEMVEVINASYTDLSVSLEQLQGYRNTPVFQPSLWVVAREQSSGIMAGCGIADFDPVAGEGILEWIQVLPGFRGRGIGALLVCELLRRMAGNAQFATVSGQVDNATDPQGLYRRCGFIGSDVWHILRSEN